MVTLFVKGVGAVDLTATVTTKYKTIITTIQTATFITAHYTVGHKKVAANFVINTAGRPKCCRKRCEF